MILILCGKAACGKDTLFKKLVNENKLCKPIISTTTRPMRAGEKEGREYYFVDEKTFKSQSDNWIECREYKTQQNDNPVTWYYGSPRVDINTPKDYAVILDIDGVHDYINAYGKENLFVVMIETYNDIRLERAKTRGSFNMDEWKNRLNDDDKEFSEDRTKPVVDTVIKNNTTIEDAYDELVTAINNRKIKKYIIPVSWEVYSTIEVEATSAEEAIKMANENIDYIPVDNSAEYIDGSYRIDSESVNEVENNFYEHIGEHGIKRDGTVF